MKPLYFLLPITLAALFAACSTDTKTDPSYPPLDHPSTPNEDMAKMTNLSLEELYGGWNVYNRKCGECHRKKLPENLETEAWKRIVPHMAWNSGISQEEENSLLTYLLAANRYINRDESTYPPLPQQ